MATLQENKKNALVKADGLWINLLAIIIKALPREFLREDVDLLCNGGAKILKKNLASAIRQAIVDTIAELKDAQAAKVVPASLAVPAEKFALLADLGTITVPDGYDHATRLYSFGKKHRKEFYYYNDAITDENFSNPTRILKPGDKLHVRAFKQVVSGTTTSGERMAFLATQKAIYTGAQGASLVFEEKRDQLLKGKWYASFDEPDRLWKDAGGYHRVPNVCANSDGVFRFDLGRFGRVWGGNRAFLCFSDFEPESSGP